MEPNFCKSEHISWGLVRSHTKFGPVRSSRLSVTNKQSLKVPGFQCASRPYSILTLLLFYGYFSWIFKNRTFLKEICLILTIHEPSLFHVRSHKKLGPIGSAVLTFIGYKQTDKHHDRQAKFIYRFQVVGNVSSL